MKFTTAGKATEFTWLTKRKIYYDHDKSIHESIDSSLISQIKISFTMESLILAQDER